MCHSGCPFEDHIGNCTVTREEEKLLGEIFVWTDPCPEYHYESEEEKALARKIIEWLIKHRENDINFQKDNKEKKRVGKMGNHKRTACIDIDGTIADYSKGWQGNNIFGEPIPGAKEYLEKLREDGWVIIIFSTRSDDRVIAQYLDSYEIPYDYINWNPDSPADTNAGKPIADVYLDDRGITFNGDWKKAYKDISRFKPWYVK